MRKTIAAIALSALSTVALAANDGTIAGSRTGATVSSGAFAASSGNGSARTFTEGHQTSYAGVSAGSDASYRLREGYVRGAGVAGAHGSSFSVTETSGQGIAGSGTIGHSSAKAGMAGYFDTHRSNPEGWALGKAKAKNGNAAGTLSAGGGFGIAGNESGTTAYFKVKAWGNRDGNGTYRNPTVDSVATSAKAGSVSYDNGGSYSAGQALAGEKSRTKGWSLGAAHAESGNVHSNN